MISFRYFAIFSAIFSLVLVVPYLSITGFDIIGFDAGGEGEIRIDSGPLQEIIVPPPIPPPVDDDDDGGGVGIPAMNLDAIPSEFNINLAINTNVEKILTITNLRSWTVNVSVRQSNLDNMIIFKEEFLYLLAGESKNLEIVFVALNDTGTFTGEIIIGNKRIPVSLNIQTKLLLFDSNIVVLNKDYKVSQGGELKTKVILTPLGDESRLDVTLKYVIKDYKNKIYLTKSETLLVEKQIDFKRNFDTGILPTGSYIIGLELVYPNGIALSSAHFEVVSWKTFSFGSVVTNLIILILITMISILVLLILELYKKRKNLNELQTPAV